MTPAERFLAALCSPFAANVEQVVATTAQLAERLAAMPAEALDCLTDRLESTSGPRGRLWRKWSFIAAVAVVLGTTVIEGVTLRNGPALAIFWAGAMGDDHPCLMPLGGIPGGPSTEDLTPLALDRLNFHPTTAEACRFAGDPQGALPGHPHSDDPAQYLNDLRAGRYGNPLTGEKGTLKEWPSDFAATGAVLDPDNGWFNLIQAENQLHGKLPTYYRYSPSSPLPTTSNPVALADAMRGFSESTQRLRHQSYSGTCLHYRASQIPPARDTLDQFLRLYLVSSNMYEGSLLNQLPQGLATEAGRLVTAGDREGLSKLTREWLTASSLLVASLDNYPEASQCLTLLFSGRELAKALHATSQHDEARRIEAMLASWESQWLQSRERSAWIYPRTAPLARMFAQSSPLFTSIPDSAFDPSRQAVRAIHDRIVAWEGLAVVLILILLLEMAPFCHSAWSRTVSAQLPRLLDGRDRLWIAGIGIGMPLVLYGAVSVLSPLGCRDYGDRWLSGFVFGAQVGGAVLLSITLTLETTAWRLARCLPAPGRKNRWLAATKGLLPLACVVMIVGSGCLRYPDFYSENNFYVFDQLTIYQWVFGLPLAGLLLRLGWLTFSRSSESWLHLGILRAAQRGLLLLACVLIATIPLSIHVERKWIARDPLFTPTSADAVYGPAVEDALANFKKKLTDTLGTM